MFLDDFILRNNSICQSLLEYDPFELLNFAELACEKDPYCIGITDNNCDKIGPFHLCKTGFLTLESYTPSCVYQKEEYIGIKQ